MMSGEDHRTYVKSTFRRHLHDRSQTCQGRPSRFGWFSRAENIYLVMVVIFKNDLAWFQMFAMSGVKAKIRPGVEARFHDDVA